MNLNIKNLVYQLIPPHKRLPNRTGWLWSLTGSLSSLWNEFVAWRANTRMMVNVNSQKLVLENYLTKKYRQQVRIRIEDYDDQLLEVSKDLLESEATMPGFCLLVENKDFPEIPLQGELRQRFDDVDFIVCLPKELEDKEYLVSAEIEKYKQAQLKYRIQKQTEQ